MSDGSFLQMLAELAAEGLQSVEKICAGRAGERPCAMKVANSLLKESLVHFLQGTVAGKKVNHLRIEMAIDENSGDMSTAWSRAISKRRAMSHDSEFVTLNTVVK